MIQVLRLGHRRGRDDRISTHVGLVARGFGADKIVYAGEEDEKILASLRDVVDRWGGNFQVSYDQSWRQVIKKFDGLKVHLSMYSEPYQTRISEIRRLKTERDILVIVGAEKVPSGVYELADYNLSVTNQPHSEIAALAVFLHDLFEGKELNCDYKDAKLQIEPQKNGKSVRDLGREPK